MATETNENVRTRTRKVYYYRPRRRQKNFVEHPAIRIEGKYLRQFGFKIGDQIEVTCSMGTIRIRKL